MDQGEKREIARSDENMRRKVCIEFGNILTSRKEAYKALRTLPHSLLPRYPVSRKM